MWRDRPGTAGTQSGRLTERADVWDVSPPLPVFGGIPARGLQHVGPFPLPFGRREGVEYFELEPMDGAEFHCCILDLLFEWMGEQNDTHLIGLKK